MGMSKTGDLAPAIGAIPSGCFVMTAGDTQSGIGMLASWVQQCSFDPPMLTASVKNGRPIAEIIEQTGHFVLNLVGEPPTAMFRHFGKGFAPGEPSFEGLATRATPQGVVIEDCPGFLACKVVSRHVAGDHSLYMAQIQDGALKGGTKPYVHIRKNGFDY